MFNDFSQIFHRCFNDCLMMFLWFFLDVSMIVRRFFTDFFFMFSSEGRSPEARWRSQTEAALRDRLIQVALGISTHTIHINTWKTRFPFIARTDSFVIDFASRFPPRQLEASSPETSRPGGFEALEKIDKQSSKNR